MSAQERQTGWRGQLTAIDHRFANNPRARGRLAIAVGATLVPGLIALIFSHIPSPSETTSESMTTVVTGRPPLVPDTTPRRTQPTAVTTTTTMSEVSPTVHARPSRSVPFEELVPRQEQDLMANHTYIRLTLAPLLTDAGLTIVEPINEDVEDVNLPNQFIVTEDGVYGSQFSVEDMEAGGKNVSAMVFGKLSKLRDGRVYFRAVFNGELGHQEGTLILGQPFVPEDLASVQEAVQYVMQTNKEVTQRMASDDYIPDPA